MSKQHAEYREQRPWGYFIVLVDKPGYKIKLLVIKPGHKLSLQFHEHRNEYWTVVQGEGIVTLDTHKSFLEKGDHHFIPIGLIHRVENPLENSEALKVVEVSMGSYLGENDVIRLDDQYSRN